MIEKHSEEGSPGHEDFTDGGDVRSDPATIRALREGVTVENRAGYVAVGKEILPITVAYNGDGSSKAQLMGDVVAEYDRRAEGPRGRSGLVELHGLEAIIGYTNAHKTQHAAGFMNARAVPPRLDLVLDYHPANQGGAGTRWCRDRAGYALELSRQWKAWTQAEGRLMGQTDFADFIEENEGDFGTPTAEMPDAVPAGIMIETARNLSVQSKSVYSRKINVNTGENLLISKDEHDAETSTRIPRGFMLALPVFEGAPMLYPIEAQLRFRMEAGKPTFAFVLKDRQRAYDAAIEHVRSTVQEATKVPVYAGAAPAPAK
jgi:uncharacterized protein YfdQ (DUF2303 family)